LVGFKLYEVKESLVTSEVYNGNHSFNSLVAQVSFNSCSKEKIELFNTKQSLLLRNELVTSVLKLSEE